MRRARSSQADPGPGPGPPGRGHGAVARGRTGRTSRAPLGPRQPRPTPSWRWRAMTALGRIVRLPGLSQGWRRTRAGSPSCSPGPPAESYPSRSSQVLVNVYRQLKTAENHLSQTLGNHFFIYFNQSRRLRCASTYCALTRPRRPSLRGRPLHPRPRRLAHPLAPLTARRAAPWWSRPARRRPSTPYRRASTGSPSPRWPRHSRRLWCGARHCHARPAHPRPAQRRHPASRRRSTPGDAGPARLLAAAVAMARMW